MFKDICGASKDPRSHGDCRQECGHYGPLWWGCSHSSYSVKWKEALKISFRKVLICTLREHFIIMILNLQYFANKLRISTGITPWYQVSKILNWSFITFLLQLVKWKRRKEKRRIKRKTHKGRKERQLKPWL